MSTSIEARPTPVAESPGSTPDPFAELDRLVSDLAAPWFGPSWYLRTVDPAAPNFAPALADVEDQGTNYEIRADLPGIAKDQIDVRIHGDLLVIRAEATSAKDDGAKNFLRHERTYRGFERAIRLPEPVLGEKVEAKFENGTVTISVPKAHPSEERKVPVA
jgi:HSP20 family protein